MKTWAVLIYVGLLSCGPALLMAQETSRATVKVIGFVSEGLFLVDAPKIKSFKSIESSHDFAAGFESGVAEGIPFGAYRIEAAMSGFVPINSLVQVDQEETTIVLGFPLASSVEPGYSSLPGQVTGRKLLDVHRSFVRLVGVYSGLSKESKIDLDGRFEFKDLPSGMYLLMVVTEARILASRIVSLPMLSTQPFEITIGRDPPPPM